MKKIYLLICVLAFSFYNIQAANLDDSQLKIQQIAIETALEYCFENPRTHCFINELQAIAWQESSFGKFIIGDSKGYQYYYRHYDKKIFIKKHQIFNKNGVLYYLYKPHKNVYFKKVYKIHDWKSLSESSLGPFQIKLETAKEIITKRGLTQYWYLLNNEKRLVTLLLNDAKFSSVIAINYLLFNYNIALERNYKYPLFYTISKYNGGSWNRKYVTLIRNKIKKLKNES